jgi:predicted P-loop ATPase/GTPase
MQLLVAGGDRVDAGKTTFSVGLCHKLDTPGFKPRAGNDYWFDHDDYQQALAEGRLYGKDARRLAAMSPATPSPEWLNPIHRLWTPVPGSKQGLLGRTGREFLVDRVRGTHETHWVVNGTIDLPASAQEQLPVKSALEVNELTEFNDVMYRLHKPAMDAAAARIDNEEQAVVESYADIARPIEGYEPDAVAVVEPRRVRVYDGGRYADACTVAAGSARQGALEETTENVLDLITPQARVELPALTETQRTRPSAIAKRYRPGYEALVETAME